MKNLLIRLFLLSSIYFMTNGSVLSCDDEDELSLDVVTYIEPEFAAVGSTIYCNISYASDANIKGWRFREKPSESNAEFIEIDWNESYFIADKPGIYTFELAYNRVDGDGPYYNVHNVEAKYLGAIAGQSQVLNAGEVASLDGSGSFGEQLTYLWSVLQAPQGANTQITNSTSVFASYLVDIAGEYFVELKVTDGNQNSDYDTLKITAREFTGDIWTRLTGYPGEGTHGIVAVSIGSFGYVGLGATTTNVIKKDFWKFDPAGNGGLGSWVKLSDFPANDTRDCAAFVLDNKIYVGLGASSNPIETSQIFYVYDPSTNAWDDGSIVQLFPGEPRHNASVFVLDGEAYVGLGYQNTYPGLLFNDMYKYNLVSNEWEQLNSFPGGARFAAISFVLNNTPYIGYGAQILPMGYIDFWSYNKSSDTWTSVQPIQPLASSDFYYHSIGVATNTNGYLIGGAIQQTDNGKQVWAFNSSSWTRKTNSIAGLTYSAGFVINNKVYCGGGTKKWYRYDPSLDQSNNKPLLSSTNRKNGQ